MNFFRSVIKILNAVLGAGMLALTANAQSLSSDVIGVAGNDMLSPSLTLSYTIGEPAVNTWSAPGMVLTEGFQQNDIVVTGIEQTAEALHVNVYPNPFAQSFTVDFGGGAGFELDVTDALGRRVSVATNVTNGKCTVDMQGMAAGLYFLTLRNGHQGMASYRIVKTNP